MIFDFGGGMTCVQCREMFEFVPLDTAVQLRGIEPGAQLIPAGDMSHEQWPHEPYWADQSWPMTCFYCNPAGWVVMAFPSGASFFRR
jgi:hypothetical protein